MWNHMTKEFGDEWEKWPIAGCGAGFPAFKRGPSMVLVMEIDAGEYMSIVAERPPELIDQAFKATRAMAYHEVMKHLDLVKLYNWLSNVYPMDKEYVEKTGFNKKEILGVNVYPIKKWEAESREYMSSTSWIRFAYFLAAGHDGPAMTELRTIEFAIEDVNPAQQEYKSSLSKKNILKKAQEKLLAGMKIPETKEDVNRMGSHIAKYVVPAVEEPEEG